MREVTGPHCPIDADVFPQLHAHRVVLESPVAELAHVLTRRSLQRRHVQQLFRPPGMADVALVRLLHPVRDPPDVVLGEEDAQLREPIEGAREDELGGVLSTQPTEFHVGKLADDPTAFSHLGVRVGVMEQVCALSSGGIHLHVHGERHLHVERRRPEVVVLRQRIALAVGVPPEDNPL